MAHRKSGGAVYDDAFYAWQAAGSLASARRVAPLVMEALAPRAILDVGCGLGTWLAAFGELGVADLTGIDGYYVDRSTLLIPTDRFIASDLRRPPTLGRRFDLAICLEVAEHLPREVGTELVRYLVSAAPAVLFSAAIPGQGGLDHINEQWQDHWRALFAAAGCVAVDLIRPRVWGFADVEIWYQQNMLLYCTRDLLHEHAELRPAPAEISLNVVHPQHYSVVRDQGVIYLSKALRMLPGLALASFKRRLGV
ncbi:MAG TPA: class I SAM-dependent methyltransferase [Acetobacteraceae bacterium]|nr:class I SAM-dependent methyltransferase [Acetobacteraceae bacterium]